MQFVKPAGEILPFAAPKDWDENANGPCGTLPVHRRVEGIAGASPYLSYRSNWKPSPDELARLDAGQVVEVECVHVQPALSINVVPCADPDYLTITRTIESIRGAVARAWAQEPSAQALDADLAEAISQEVGKLFGIDA